MSIKLQTTTNYSDIWLDRKYSTIIFSILNYFNISTLKICLFQNRIVWYYPNRFHTFHDTSGARACWRANMYISIRIVLISKILFACSFPFAVASGVMCYQCNSEYDPRCGDPFNEYGLGMVNCSLKDRLEHLRDVEPTLCRKTTQKSEYALRWSKRTKYILQKRNIRNKPNENIDQAFGILRPTSGQASRYVHVGITLCVAMLWCSSALTL